MKPADPTLSEIAALSMKSNSAYKLSAFKMINGTKNLGILDSE